MLVLNLECRSFKSKAGVSLDEYTFLNLETKEIVRVIIEAEKSLAIGMPLSSSENVIDLVIEGNGFKSQIAAVKETGDKVKYVVGKK